MRRRSKQAPRPVRGANSESDGGSLASAGPTLTIAHGILAALLGCMLAGATRADPCVDYRQFLHTTAALGIPGAGSIAVAADRAYVGAGTNLVVLDVSAPDSPVVLGQAQVAAPANDVAVSGDHVLVAAGWGGLRVIDVSNPASPQIVGSLATVGSATELVASGNLAFVAASGVGTELEIIDVTVPSAPVRLASIPPSYQGTPVSFFVSDVAVAGNLLYVLSFDLQIFDVTDPSAPALLGTYTPDVYFTELALVGGMAYIGRPGGTLVIDISNPAAPALASTPWLGSGSTGWNEIIVSGHHAFVGFPSNSYALLVFDVSDPAAPVAVGAVPTPTGQSGVAVSGERLFAAGGIVGNGEEGVSVVDIDPPLSPPAIRVDTPGDAQAVALAGHHAYVADGTSLQVVDVSDRFAPRIAGSLAVEASAVATDGNLAITAGGGTTRVIDISNPAAPAVLGSLPGNALDLELVGSRAYRADGDLDIIDVSNPAAPVLLGSSTVAADHVEIDGQYAYTSRRMNSTISVLDVSGNVPVVVGSAVYNQGWTCEGFAHEGEFVLCSDRTHGYTTVYDVAVATAPYYESIIRLGSDALQGGNPLYFINRVNDNGELWILLALPPDEFGYASPAVGALAGPIAYGRDNALEVAGGLVLVASGANGLYVLPAHCDMTTDAVEESARRSGPLFEAWPTPARGPLSLRFSLPRGESVRLRVYDVAGRRLRDVVQRWYPAGTHIATWDGLDERGRAVGSGVYSVLLTTSSTSARTRVVILR